MFNSNPFNRQYLSKKYYSTPVSSVEPTMTAVESATTSTTVPQTQTFAKKSFWSSMGRGKKTFTFYVGTVFCAYVFNTYRDGQQALFNHRIKRQLICLTNPVELIKPSSTVKDEEFSAVVEGCRDVFGDRWFMSMVYPYTVVTSIIPFVVTLLNSKN